MFSFISKKSLVLVEYITSSRFSNPLQSRAKVSSSFLNFSFSPAVFCRKMADCKVDLQNLVKEQGDVVRKLKEAKAPKEDVILFNSIQLFQVLIASNIC
jgi:hypothetical protein